MSATGATPAAAASRFGYATHAVSPLRVRRDAEGAGAGVAGAAAGAGGPEGRVGGPRSAETERRFAAPRASVSGERNSRYQIDPDAGSQAVADSEAGELYLNNNSLFLSHSDTCKLRKWPGTPRQACWKVELWDVQDVLAEEKILKEVELANHAASSLGFIFM
ncbi:MAG: hypothetical protein BJ554DRAFT_2148 [Olpidium bornovanus]|uniref:Uncharacterized protein n=1 Tax=Olpidium bornovanus TaxID=278681 RepID=A0A8H8DGN3_9FUNG|nr:MAG: hypothetical protein BJ554DRAFT_2148 [Olpidium bornovanus]